jgi:hypothetical protein
MIKQRLTQGYYQNGQSKAWLMEKVRQRVKRGSMSGRVGHTSPMAQNEPYLVELILQLSYMRTPIIASQGLQLANSLIKSIKIEDFVMEWKSKNLPCI